MTQEQIEQVAIEAAINVVCIQCYKPIRIGCKNRGKGCANARYAYNTFLAGAQSRQAEIDQLTSDIERYKNDVAEGLQREYIAKIIIDVQRDEIKQLLKKYSE